MRWHRAARLAYATSIATILWGSLSSATYAETPSLDRSATHYRDSSGVRADEDASPVSASPPARGLLSQQVGTAPQLQRQAAKSLSGAHAMFMLSSASNCVSFTYDKNSNRTSQSTSAMPSAAPQWGQARMGCFIWN